MTIGTRAALRALLDEPGGRVFLGLLVVAFAGHAGWRFLQAFADADKKGDDLKGLLGRAGKLGGALASMALAVYAACLLFGWGTDIVIRDGVRGDWIAWLLHRPWGRSSVGAVGLLVMVGGVVGSPELETEFQASFRHG